MTSKSKKQLKDEKPVSEVVEEEKEEKEEKPVSEVDEKEEKEEKEEKPVSEADDNGRKIRDYKTAWAAEMMSCRHIEEKVLAMTAKFSTFIDDCEALYNCIPDKKLQDWLVKGISGFKNEYIELIKDITDFREQRQRVGWQKYGRGEYVLAMLKFNQEYAPDSLTESDMKTLEELEKKRRMNESESSQKNNTKDKPHV